MAAHEAQGEKRRLGKSSMDGMWNLSSFLGGKGRSTAADGEEEEAEEGWRHDPLFVFGSGIMTVILSKLDARSVALSRSVSRGWLAVASSDKIWASKLLHIYRMDDQGQREMRCRYQSFIKVFREDVLGSIVLTRVKCEELWRGKAHIPRISKVQGLSKMAATSLSIMDGKRSRITRIDLCDHVWEFHFTEAAPEYWRNLDPYWQGTGPAMRRYFHPDGSITADPDDRVWGGHESTYTIVTGLLADGKIREHYVRINRWPKLTVQRRADWGWFLSNNLYCYTSVPDAHLRPEGTGPFFPTF